MPTQHRSRPRTQDRSTASTGEALRSIFNRNFNVVACINLLVMTAYYLMFALVAWIFVLAVYFTVKLM